MPEIDSIQLAKCINRLKDRERRILFARVFGELDFTELGRKFGLEPKQAEMAYYYIIRKLCKEMGVRKDAGGVRICGGCGLDACAEAGYRMLPRVKCHFYTRRRQCSLQRKIMKLHVKR